MKRFLICLLACLLVFSSVMVCFAEDGVITVKNTKYDDATGLLTFFNRKYYTDKYFRVNDCIHF